MTVELNVRFKKKLYGSEDGDFSIFSAEPASTKDSRLVDENKYGTISISGDFFIQEEELGRKFKVTIEEDYNSKYPNSYKLLKLHYEFPSDPKEQWDYLKNSGLMPLGTFIELKRHFAQDENILDIITEEPEKLTKVHGIGEERAAKYQSKLIENKEKALLFAEYGKIEGVGAKMINKLYSWKPSVADVLTTLEKDPFRIIIDLDVNFVTADRFREFYKFPLDDENRILHGVKYYLNEYFANTGNTYEDVMEVSKMISQKLHVDYKKVVYLVASIKDDVIKSSSFKLKIFGRNITTEDLFNAELTIYQKMKSLISEPSKITDTTKWLQKKELMLEEFGAKLSDEQDSFLNSINENRVQILLGPGGTGKSWVINIACNMIKSLGKTFGLFAPTARAAKVMSDYVGVEAMTIHRGLMRYAAAGEIAPFDVLVVDEFSMVDSELASIIMQVMGEKTRLIIVGDDYQLQSVGPGNVLLDLVQSVGVPTVRLTKVFRQADKHGLLDYAQALREGTFNLPSDAPRIEDNNIVFIQETEDSRKQEIALKLYKDALARVDGDYEDIMLLTPSNKGPSGRKSMNKKIQEIVNPSDGKHETVFGAGSGEENKRFFRRGDYITVTSNQYEMINDIDEVTSIINGDLGEITDAKKEGLTFKVNGNSYTVEKSGIIGLIDHAWAITIHKSQGGQASEVIIVIPENAAFMLNANMIYTAITRTKRKCYMIGDFKALNKAGKKQANLLRKTMIQLKGDIERKKQKALEKVES